ncbi:FG-GAP repeat domain-containing protein [Streptomyces sp. NPDC008163]|uniref:FG-GAP repeat domain-containing protein n=1 Tax=Streptomyces sp. NPDC008163 TaxID=3364818 RepID=UPI0036EA96F4
MEPGRSAVRPKRASRTAACTALVLTAGMLLAAPASADGPASGTPGAQSPSSVVPAKPLRDLDGDGVSNMLYRDLDGILYTSTKSYGTHPYDIDSADPHEMFKDIITPGDLDGDGKPEILGLSVSGKLSLFRSTGEKGTGRATWSGNGWQKYNKVVAPGDLDGDGRADLIARTPSGDTYVYISTGSVKSAPFKAGVKVGYGWNVYDQIVGTNDVNRDGLGDIITRTPAGDVYFYAGTGDAAKPFKARVKVGYGWDVYNQIVGVDDLDGDGLGDLVTRRPNGDSYVYHSIGDGTFRAREASSTGRNGAALFVGEGGNPDWGKHMVLVRTKAGGLYWYDSANNGQFLPRGHNGDDEGWNKVGLALASSLNNGGGADLVQNYDGTLIIDDEYLGTGWQVYNNLTGPGDLSGDGNGDLLARDTKGDLYLYRGNGLGTEFAAKVKVGYGYDTYTALVGSGDLSGDGIADVVARDTKGDLYLYKGTGNAAKPLSARVKIGYGYNTYKQIAAPGDLDGDGFGDLIGVDGKGDVYRYSSTGTGQVEKRVKIGYGWDIYNGVF